MNDRKQTTRHRPALVFTVALLLAAWALPARAGFFDALRGILRPSPWGGASGLTQQTIADGIREALRVGTDHVVARLGRPGGFASDPVAHIPLPGALATVQNALARIGMSGIADDLEARLNSAAEAALPEARAVFWKTISEMTLDDVMAIYRGPEDAATRYFEEKMTPELTSRMKPIVQDKLSQVGAVATFDTMMARYRALPLAPPVDADLSEYVVGKALDGTFHYVAEEEAAIRRDPAARTTDLLKKVFGTAR
ncbi:MAG: DUF4197 domain-containing protein [Deltaproteobacteria bacterium]|nr:MAG: DUF4197 domain-containing protein [Deltaproteobacteria bacterium]